MAEEEDEQLARLGGSERVALEQVHVPVVVVPPEWALAGDRFERAIVPLDGLGLENNKWHFYAIGISTGWYFVKFFANIPPGVEDMEGKALEKIKAATGG